MEKGTRLEETRRFHSQTERHDWVDDPQALSAVYHRRCARDTVNPVRRHWRGGAYWTLGQAEG